MFGSDTAYSNEAGATTLNVPTKLAYVVLPSNTSAGGIISPSVVIAVQNAQGAAVTNATNVVKLPVGSNPGGGTLSGTVSVAAVNGIATFNNIRLTKLA